MALFLVQDSKNTWSFLVNFNYCINIMIFSLACHPMINKNQKSPHGADLVQACWPCCLPSPDELFSATPWWSFMQRIFVNLFFLSITDLVTNIDAQKYESKSIKFYSRGWSLGPGLSLFSYLLSTRSFSKTSSSCPLEYIWFEDEILPLCS